LFNDAQHIYKWLAERYSEDKIYVYGRSLGSGIAARIASWNNPNLLILDSPYYSFYHVVKQTLFLFPLKLILRYDIRTDRYLKDTHCPIYLLHGTKDRLFPLWHSQKLKALYPSKITLYEIENAHHNNLTEFPQFHEYLYNIVDSNTKIDKTISDFGFRISNSSLLGETESSEIRNRSSEIERVFDILTYQQHKYPQKKALNRFTKGAWSSFGIEEIIRKTNQVSLWLLDAGYQKGDKVAVMPNMGRPEWMIIDFACQQIGLIIVPIHPTASEKEILFILSHTHAKLCIASNKTLQYKVQLSVGEVGKNQLESGGEMGKQTLKIYHLDAKEVGYFEVLSSAKKDGLLEGMDKLNSIKDGISPEDVLTIMYTSGTSGTPKGVVLTHANLVSNILSSMEIFPLQSAENVLSMLPFSHILERAVCYTYVACGVSVFFSKEKESVVADFKSVRPVFCTMVPLILEKLYGGVQQKSMDKNMFKRGLIKFAIRTANLCDPSKRQGIGYKIRLKIAQALVLDKWHAEMGGKLRYVLVGAAALKPEIGRFFAAAHVNICQGYGMTETSPLISSNRFEKGLNRFGTVGIPAPHVEVKIDAAAGEDGEIMVKGKNVTQGYYQNPEMTAAAFTTDGWFRTGDVGRWVDGRFLQITDRKKDIFKTTTGKYVAPQQLETHLSCSPFVHQSLIVGFNRPYIVALIVPNFDFLKTWCVQYSIHWTEAAYMIHNIKVVGLMNQEIDRINKDLQSHERIRDFILCSKEWTVESGELTASFKPIRGVIEGRFLKEIEKVYLKNGVG
jgi:long-chain acyl-CoA synthetase